MFIITTHTVYYIDYTGHIYGNLESDFQRLIIPNIVIVGKKIEAATIEGI